MQRVYDCFGKRLKELREANKITQEQLAEYIGVEARQISRIETGRCFTTLDNLEKISEFYDLEIKDVFDFGHFKTKKEIIDLINAMLDSASEESCRKIFKIIREII